MPQRKGVQVKGRRTQGSSARGNGKRQSLRRPETSTPQTLPDWLETIVAYKQKLAPAVAAQIVGRLRGIATLRRADDKVFALEYVLHRMNIPAGVQLWLAAGMGLTREPHDIDRVAAEILAVM